MTATRGVPAWIRKLAREIEPRSDMRRVRQGTELHVFELVVRQANVWIAGGMPEKHLDCMEVLCGAGHTSDAVAALGGKVRRFDRTPWGLGVKP